MAKDRITDTHPAYGVAVFSRAQGNPGKLFGSSLRDHRSFVILSIRSAERYHDTGRDWIHPKNVVTEVYFSAAQFAQLITTMNVGDGTPCTIKHLNGVEGRVPNIPEDDATENERCYNDFEKRVHEIHANTERRVAELQMMLENKPTITKVDRGKIISLLRDIQREVKGNIPYQIEAFQEAVEKTTQQAKAEIDASVTVAIQKAGMESLREKWLATTEADLKELSGRKE
jgi:hypothetical protein